VGCGTAESLKLWQRAFRPKQLVGVTSMPSHVDFARLSLPDEVELHCADAVAWTNQSPATFDRIFALDCAYHFQTRRRFLRSAYSRLAPGGRVALADLIVADEISLRDKLLLRLVCLASGTPWCNMYTVSTYRAHLADAGYTSVDFTDLTPHVFAGLARYLETRPSQAVIRAVTPSTSWIGYTGFARVLRWWATGRVVRFVIVGGQRPPL
jgi:SAM-dependent methyltransferase